MTLGPTAFAVVLWGAVIAVLAVLASLAYALAVDAGWLNSGGGGNPARAGEEE